MKVPGTEHVHAGEDEMFYRLAGELSVFCAEDRWMATPGSFVFVPRDHRHGFVVTNARSCHRPRWVQVVAT